MKQKQILRRKHSKKHLRKQIYKKVSHEFEENQNKRIHQMQRVFKIVDEKKVTSKKAKTLLYMAGYNEQQRNQILKKCQRQNQQINDEIQEKYDVTILYRKCLKIMPVADLGKERFTQLSQCEEGFVTLQDLKRVNERLGKFNRDKKLENKDLREILREGSKEGFQKLDSTQFQELYKKSEMIK